MRISDYLRYLRIKRTLTVAVNLTATSVKCHRTTLWNGEMQRLSIWLKVSLYRFPPNVDGSEKGGLDCG